MLYTKVFLLAVYWIMSKLIDNREKESQEVKKEPKKIEKKWCMGCQTHHSLKNFIGDSCKIYTIKQIYENKYDTGCSYETYRIDVINNVYVKDLISERIFNKYINVSNRSRCESCYTYFKNIDMYRCQYDDICKKCIQMHFEKNNNEYMGYKPKYSEYTILCPCGEETILLSKYVSEEVYNKTMISKGFPKPQYCYRHDCNGSLKGTKCRKCGDRTCVTCHQKFHEGKCKKEDLKTLDVIVKSAGNDFKNCPNCKELIFKSEGCNNQFCWNCSRLFEWDTGELKGSFACSDKNYYEIYKNGLKKGYDSDDMDPTDFENYYDFNKKLLG